MQPSCPLQNLCAVLCRQPFLHQIWALAYELLSYPVAVREINIKIGRDGVVYIAKLIVAGAPTCPTEESGSEFVAVHRHCYLGGSSQDVETSTSWFMRVLDSERPHPTYRDESSGSSGRGSYDNDPLLAPVVSASSAAPVFHRPARFHIVHQLTDSVDPGGRGVRGFGAILYRTVGSWQSM